MVSNGCTLHGYQQSSLRWMLDKEKEATGLGLAGELWHRLRFLEKKASTATADFFYCDLTGSFALDIFDFQSSSGQKTASRDRFCKPSGGIMGEEMGLGKTAISIALILANQPPPHRRVLPREHELLHGRKNFQIQHPDYLQPPIVGSGKSAGKTLLSNGTLVIVPINLSSQWQSELKRFAPELSVELLHAAKNQTAQSIASADVVIAPTTLLQIHRGKGCPAGIARRIKKVHWHRIIVDEAHQQGQDSTIAKNIAALNATYRHSLSGTPLGASLNDLQGQLHLLRLPPFHRPKFWENNMARPYKNGNPEALRVVRSMLSHIVCRHSKEQTDASGTALLALPPRSVETVLLRFGSEDEQIFYGILEKYSRDLLASLKETPKASANVLAMLNNLLLQSKQACNHVGLVCLQKLDRLNRAITGLYVGAKQTRKATKGSKTRADLLKLAARKARPGCRIRMVNAVQQYQGDSEQAGALLGCPICLENVDEGDIAVLPCAHPICQHCVLSLLSANGGTSTRGSTASCPECRGTFREKDLTFLGDAEELIFANKKIPAKHTLGGMKLVPNPTATLQSFKLNAKDVRQVAIGATVTRANRGSLPDVVFDKKLQIRNAQMPTLEKIDPALLASYYRAETKIGTKIARLLEEVQTLMEQDETSKFVVFSQYAEVLDTAAIEFMARGIECRGIYGNMKQHKRADALNDFQADSNVKVILLSMRGGAAGLNLTSANVCFILDVAQNAALEEQAIDRIHRIGQTRPVLVKRFVMQDTVEERLTAVRRTLQVDKPVAVAGTAVSGKTKEETTQLEMMEQLVGVAAK